MNKIEKMAQNIYSDMNQENINKVKKEKVIFNIKEIIQEFGQIGTYDVQADSSPVIQTKDGLIHLVENFNKDTVEVWIYKSGESEETHIYNILYEELELNVLLEILKLAEQFKEQELEDI